MYNIYIMSVVVWMIWCRPVEMWMWQTGRVEMYRGPGNRKTCAWRDCAWRDCACEE